MTHKNSSAYTISIMAILTAFLIIYIKGQKKVIPIGIT